MARRKSGRASRVIVWIILGLLVVGLAGFGVTNFGGSSGTIGRVGDRDITANRYARELQQELRAYGSQIGRSLSLQEARSIGLDSAVLARLIATTANEYEADRIGISAGDEEIAQQLRDRPDLQGLDGTFDPVAYQFALDQLGMNPRQFEDALRAEIASSIVQAAVTVGFDAPPIYARLVRDYLGQRRSFSWITLDETSLETPLPAASDAVLRTYYDENTDEFQLPETRTITYAWLSPDMILDEIEVSEDELRALYADRADLYNLPERRLVERLTFSDDATAIAAMAAISSGQRGFAALVAERGLDLADIDLGDVSQAELGTAGAEVFVPSEPGIVGPVNTDLGPAIFRVNAILSARQTAFEDVADDLRTEFAGDRARRQIADQITGFDDLLAGGATLEELAQETAMQLGSLDWFAGMSQGIAAYQAFSASAAAASENDFPEIAELDDGGVFALRIDRTTPPRPEPFDQARTRVAQAWASAELSRLLLDQAAVMKAGLDAGARLSGTGFETNVETRLRRSDFIENAPRAMIVRAFELERGETAVVEGDDRVVILTLDAIHAAEPGDADLAARVDAITSSALQSIANDALDAFTRAIQLDAGISLNQTAISAIQAQFP